MKLWGRLGDAVYRLPLLYARRSYRRLQLHPVVTYCNYLIRVLPRLTSRLQQPPCILTISIDQPHHVSFLYRLLTLLVPVSLSLKLTLHFLLIRRLLQLSTYLTDPFAQALQEDRPWLTRWRRDRILKFSDRDRLPPKYCRESTPLVTRQYGRIERILCQRQYLVPLTVSCSVPIKQ